MNETTEYRVLKENDEYVKVVYRDRQTLVEFEVLFSGFQHNCSREVHFPYTHAVLELEPSDCAEILSALQYQPYIKYVRWAEKLRDLVHGPDGDGGFWSASDWRPQDRPISFLCIERMSLEERDFLQRALDEHTVTDIPLIPGMNQKSKSEKRRSSGARKAARMRKLRAENPEAYRAYIEAKTYQ